MTNTHRMTAAGPVPRGSRQPSSKYRIYSITLQPPDADFLRALGMGNLSQGIRNAAAECRSRQPEVQNALGSDCEALLNQQGSGR